MCFNCKNDDHIAKFSQNLVLPPNNSTSNRLVHFRDEKKTEEKRDRDTSSEISSHNQSVIEIDNYRCNSQCN